LKGKARLDVPVSTRHSRCVGPPHPCGLTLPNRYLFSTQSLRHKEFLRLPLCYLDGYLTKRYLRGLLIVIAQ